MGENVSLDSKLQALEQKKFEEIELKREYEKLQEELVKKQAQLVDKDAGQELGE